MVVERCGGTLPISCVFVERCVLLSSASMQSLAVALTPPPRSREVKIKTESSSTHSHCRVVADWTEEAPLNRVS